MKPKIFWFVYCLGIVLVTAACAPTTSKSEPIVVARPERQPWPDEVMWVRPNGAAGKLVAYNMGNGRSLFSLSAGILSANQQHFASASQQENVTTIEMFDPKQGSLVNRFNLDGRWQLKGMSPNGRWLALIADGETQTKSGWYTEIAVVTADDGRLAHTIQLDGRFEIDALANDGAGLFLIQYVPPEQPDQYVVRLYDLAQDELLPDALRDKRATDEVMTGYAWGTVADAQGQWWHTLYVSTQRNKAFIHALNLHSRWPVCIDLPSGEGDFATLQQYALALSADGQTIYATNPALGIVAEVSLANFEVVSQVEFEATESLVGEPAALLSSDGNQLFFTNGRQIWRYDTENKTVSSPYLAEPTIAVQGLGLSGDGERLAVALAERPLQLFAVDSGEALAWSGEEVATRP